ncbi:MAG TPA: hypothetical protein VK504_25345 [Vicinamibacterales bacterium]|nr:hypothetical protein [Vicinamibacterales bacterium]
MNLVLSHPTSRGGGMMWLPVSGVAHIDAGDSVVSVQLSDVTFDLLGRLDLVGVGLPEGAEIWFEDERERSH